MRHPIEVELQHEYNRMIAYEGFVIHTTRYVLELAIPSPGGKVC